MIENSQNITMAGNAAFCPACGGVAQFIEGRFDVVDGAIQMHSGPAWSWDVVEQLRLTLKRVADERPDDPIAQVEAVNPGLGSRLRGLTQNWTREQIFAFIAMLFTIIDWGGVTPGDIAGWFKNVGTQVDILLDEAEKHGPPSPPTH